MLTDVEEDGDGPEDNPKTAEIKKWLVKVTPKKDSTISVLGVGNDNPNANPNIKLRQMELEFVSRVSRMMDKPSPPTAATPVVEEAAQPKKKRKKTLKVLAKENA